MKVRHTCPKVTVRRRRELLPLFADKWHAHSVITIGRLSRTTTSLPRRRRPFSAGIRDFCDKCFFRLRKSSTTRQRTVKHDGRRPIRSPLAGFAHDSFVVFLPVNHLFGSTGLRNTRTAAARAKSEFLSENSGIGPEEKNHVSAPIPRTTYFIYRNDQRSTKTTGQF